MRFSLWPQASQPWSVILEVATHAEATGWDGVWMADHFMPNAPGADGPVLECWTVLSGLAARVPRVRIGALVSGNTYRHPAVLANMAASVDQISGGRAVLGLGAGWQENEHRAYGIPFFDTKERLGRLDEACQVVRSLLGQERTSFEGRYYSLDRAPMEPKPVQSRLPLLVGGGGEQVTMRIAARHGDEWNVWGTPEVLRHKIGVLEQRCREVGRDPSQVLRSAQALVYLSEDRHWLERQRSRPHPMPAIVGNPGELAQVMAEYDAAGVDEFIVPDTTLGPVERRRHAMDLFLREVAGPLR